MSKKVGRRDFARTSVVAGAAAMAFPTGLIAKESAVAAKTSAATEGAAVARRRLASLPPEVAYGGVTSDTNAFLPQDAGAAQSAKTYPGGWREGTTIPAEYYVDEKHYLNDERYIAENFWLMADHESRIPKPGDYFVFEYGRGDSLIVTRDQSGAVRAFHNVCRHRGSRLCLHSFDKVLPSECRPDGKPVDSRLSVVQLGPSGNTPVFRCPYHAWTYNLEGRLVSYPPGMPTGFDAAEHGLHPAHVRTVEGFIFVSFARQEPPDFDTFVSNWRTLGQEYGTAQLKVVARKQYPTKGNWKLALENFRECYHCEASHKALIRVHWYYNGIMTPQQRARIEQELATHGHDYARRNANQQGGGGGMGMGGANVQHLTPGFVTGSLDGKPVAPLLPTRKEWTHRSRQTTTGYSTSYMRGYDDHVAVARFTPRDVALTDAEIFWLVRADASAKDVDIDRMVALWDITYREDRWIVENNHHGILNSRYCFNGGQPYAASEAGPSGVVKWYMSEVVPSASDRRTAAP
jgi:phenylpropionate dioxygenase-like ring-hydroxylating dioxygenase large terminal subunit